MAASTKAFAKLISLLRYVDGDYNDPSIYVRPGQELKGVRRPLHYLAIPPSLFATVAEGLAKQRAGTDARLVVESGTCRSRPICGLSIGARRQFRLDRRDFRCGQTFHRFLA